MSVRPLSSDWSRIHGPPLHAVETFVDPDPSSPLPATCPPAGPTLPDLELWHPPTDTSLPTDPRPSGSVFSRKTRARFCAARTTTRVSREKPVCPLRSRPFLLGRPSSAERHPHDRDRRDLSGNSNVRALGEWSRPSSRKRTSSPVSAASSPPPSSRSPGVFAFLRSEKSVFAFLGLEPLFLTCWRDKTCAMGDFTRQERVFFGLHTGHRGSSLFHPLLFCRDHVTLKSSWSLW